MSFGPISPVARPGVANYRPYMATITVLDGRGHRVTQVRSGADGQFRVSLAPGRYTLHPETSGPRPVAADITVAVAEGGFTKVGVTYDSGIR